MHNVRSADLSPSRSPSSSLWQVGRTRDLRPRRVALSGVGRRSASSVSVMVSVSVLVLVLVSVSGPRWMA